MNRFPGQFGQGTGFMQQVEQGSQQTFGVLASPTHPSLVPPCPVIDLFFFFFFLLGTQCPGAGRRWIRPDA